MGLIDCLGDVSLELESRREKIVVHSEWISYQVDGFWLLKARTLVFGREAIHVVENKFLEIRALEHIGALGHACLEFFESLLVGVDDCDAAVLERVAINEALLDERRENENVLQLFRGDVLALRKFEYVLGAVNDLDCAVREDLGNITSSEPALFIKCFCCLVVTEEVALENRRTLHANFTSRVRLVGGQVLHFRNIFKSNSQIINWSTDMTSVWVFYF